MKERGLSPTGLAKLVGASQASASRWKTGRLMPSTAFALAIERAIGMPAALWLEYKLHKLRRAA